MDAPPCFLTKGAIAGALAGLVVMVFIDCAKTGWRFARSVAARSLSHLLDCEDLSKSALLSPKQLEKLSPKISPAVLEHDELEELCSVCLAELGHDDGEGWSLSAPSSNTSRKCCGGGGGGGGGARAKTLRRLPCRHLFHAECIDPWMAQGRPCPVCRTSPASSPTSCGSSPGAPASAWRGLRSRIDS